MFIALLQPTPIRIFSKFSRYAALLRSARIYRVAGGGRKLDILRRQKSRTSANKRKWKTTRNCCINTESLDYS